MPTIIARQYAETMDQAARSSFKTMQRESFALGKQQALEELSDVYHECNEEGWDGYGARPVEQETMRCAYLIIQTLPPRFPLPSIAADPDGQIALDWRISPQRMLSVSVDPTGVLHYACIRGRNNKDHGTIPFFDSAPDKLLQLVREL